MTNLNRQQQALSTLLQGGGFRFDPAIATVPYEEFRDLIESLEPAQPYSIGYDLGGINWLENCHLDEDDHGHVELIRRERSWQYGKLRAFQLELVTVPRVIIVANEPPQDPTILDTTWYCNKNGSVVAYRQLLNGNILEDIRL